MKTETEKPTVHVIAGPNGAGKTTFATRYLPKFVDCREFLNADLIAAGLSPFAPETQNVRAGRLLLERIRELSDARATFGFETTLSGRTYAKLFHKLRNTGYQLSMYFLWLPDQSMAVARVQNRVRQGGHYIPADVIHRRYALGIRNLFHLYWPILDEVRLYDSSLRPPKLIACRDENKLTMKQKKLYFQIQRQAEKTGDENDR